jgi:hypothetical protein
MTNERKEEWIAIENEVKEIVKVCETCPETYRLKCFEILMMGFTNSGASGSIETPKPKNLVKALVPQTKVGTEFVTFLKGINLSIEEISQVVDLESGNILTRNFPSDKATIQRQIAALIAICHVYKEGDPVVPKEELKNWCNKFGALDTGNFTAIMKNAKHGTTAIFVETENGWKVTAPCYPYLAKTVKEFIGTTEQQ